MYKPVLTTVLAAASVAGCMAGPEPKNYDNATWGPGQGSLAARVPVQGIGQQQCSVQKPVQIAAMPQVDASALMQGGLRLAAGDRVQIDVVGDTDTLTGAYMIQNDGSLRLRGFPSLDVGGKSQTELAAFLQAELVAAGVIRPLARSVSVRMIESSGIPVSISGAVFSSGIVNPGERRPDSRVGQKEGAVTGDANAGRTLTAAIRAAAGVRPDADIKNVYLVRAGQYAVFDLSGWVEGHGAMNPTLAAGDQIIVPETLCFNPDLVRPTPLTQPGIVVQMSNLTKGANNNAGAGVGEKTGSLAYGTRMLQGLAAMNCVGGSALSSGRQGVLISRNPRTGESVVTERDIEELVRSVDRDQLNPYLMPGDALACYDSRWTSLREAIGFVSDVAGTATPAIILSNAAN